MKKCIHYRGFAADFDKSSYITLIEEVTFRLPRGASWGYNPDDNRYQGVIYGDNFMPVLCDSEVLFSYDPEKQPVWDKTVTKVMKRINNISIKMRGIPATISENS